MLADRRNQKNIAKSKLTSKLGVEENDNSDLTLGSPLIEIDDSQSSQERVEKTSRYAGSDVDESDGDCEEDFKEGQNFEGDEDFDTHEQMRSPKKRQLYSYSSSEGFPYNFGRSHPENTIDVVEPNIPNKSTASRKGSKKKKICHFCGRNDTPMWRRGPSGKGTLCNACGVKWSNSLKGGKKVVRRKVTPLPDNRFFDPMNFQMEHNFTGYRNDQSIYSSPSISEPPSPDRYPPDYFQQMRNKRMKLVESSKRWDDVNSSSNLLLGHLLSVVKDRVLEEQELEEIKREISVWKKDVFEMEIQHKNSSEECVKKLTNEFEFYNGEVSRLLTTANSKVSHAIQCLQSDTNIFAKEIEAIRIELRNQQNGDTASSSQKNSCLSRMKKVEDHIIQMANRIEKSLEEAKCVTSLPKNFRLDGDTCTKIFPTMTDNIPSNLKAKQESMKQNCEDIRRLNSTFDTQLNQQFCLIENVFARSQERKIPS